MPPLLRRFPGPVEKARWLDSGASLDTRLDPVRQKAHQIASARGNQLDLIARDFHHFVRDRIRYVADPGMEEFADSEEILARGFDDCDGKSRLFCALCRCWSIPCEIRPVFSSPRDFVHVQCVVRWPGSERHPRAMDGGWLLAELILRWCEIGDNPDEMPRDAAGKRVLA